MAVFGREMGVLGRKMKVAARKAQSEMRTLLDRAVQSGAAKPASP
jgi:hypothetical protein